MQAVRLHVREMLSGNGAQSGFSLKNAGALILAIEPVEEDSTQDALLDAYRWQQRSVEEDLSHSQMPRARRCSHPLACSRHASTSICSKIGIIAHLTRQIFSCFTAHILMSF